MIRSKLTFMTFLNKINVVEVSTIIIIPAISNVFHPASIRYSLGLLELYFTLTVSLNSERLVNNFGLPL